MLEEAWDTGSCHSTPMLPEYSRLPLAQTLFAMRGGTILTYDAL